MTALCMAHTFLMDRMQFSAATLIMVFFCVFVGRGEVTEIILPKLQVIEC